jgi:hypothetical protein
LPFQRLRNGYAKGLFALVALIDAGARATARKLGNAAGVGIPAMTANRAIGPMELFEMLAGLIRIGENGVCKIAHRIFPLIEENPMPFFLVRQIDNCSDLHWRCGG